jgi:sec-independent protein translocase protein TatB
MFDIAPTELMLVAIVALLVIGPKDLPKAMRFVGHWMSKARGVARQFRSGFDTMVREAELADLEKTWKEENERIMREHPPVAPPVLEKRDDLDEPAPPIMVEQPVVLPAPEESAEAPVAAPDKAPS